MQVSDTQKDQLTRRRVGERGITGEDERIKKVDISGCSWYFRAMNAVVVEERKRGRDRQIQRAMYQKVIVVIKGERSCDF